MKDFINYDDMYECIKNIYIDALDEDEVSKYENDILTAGCHKIAYTEMERMYNEIQGL